jgi:Flp pilus assembly protein TadD
MVTVAVMSDPEHLVQFQVPIRTGTRKQLLHIKADTGKTLAVLADAFIDYCSALFDADKVPPALREAIRRAESAEAAWKARKAARRDQDDED